MKVKGTKDNHQDPLLSELHARFGRRLIKLCEVADFLSCGQSTIREWVADGDLAVIKLSERAWRFQAVAIVEFIRRRDELNGSACALPINGILRPVSPLRPASSNKPANPKARRQAAAV
jgi:excisionase family DNA binding protein